MKEVEQIYKKWKENTPYLHGVNERIGRKLAIILENQRLFNEATDTEDEDTISLAAQIFSYPTMYQMVQIEPLLGSSGLIYIFNENTQTEELVKIYAKTSRLVLEIGDKKLPLHSKANWIRNKIINEIAKDLQNHCANKVKSTKGECVGAIKHFVGEWEYSWIMLNPVTANKTLAEIVGSIDWDHFCGLKDFIYGSFLLNPHTTVILNSHFHHDRILCGPSAQYSDVNAGYVYCPYVALGTLLPPNYTTTTTRYGKRLYRPDVYMDITLTDIEPEVICKNCGKPYLENHKCQSRCERCGMLFEQHKFHENGDFICDDKEYSSSNKKYVFIPLSCIGEKCKICSGQATHKVVEEFLQQEFPPRHPKAAYLCEEHFGMIMI